MTRVRAVAAGVMTALMLCVGILALSAPPASATPGHIGYAALRFNDVKEEAILIIPRPVCPAGYRCTWLLLVNEPLISNRTIVAVQCCNEPPPNRVWVRYPQDFQGIIQADAMISKVPLGQSTDSGWLYVTGARRYIDTVSTPTTTTTTTSLPTSSTTTTTHPASPTTTVPGQHTTGGGQTSSGKNDASELPFVNTSGGTTTGDSGTTGKVHTLVVKAPRTALPFTRAHHHHKTKSHQASLSEATAQPASFWSPASIALLIGVLALLIAGSWLLLAGRRRSDDEEEAPA